MENLLKLKYINSFSTSSVDVAKQLQELYAQSNVELVSFSNRDSVMSNDPKLSGSWTAFSNCILIEFEVDLYNNILITAHVYDGVVSESTLRWRALFKSDKSILSIIDKPLSTKFDNVLSDEYDRYLSKTRLDWIESRKRQILNK